MTVPGVASLPSGTVIFLFLDIEGSTGLLERIGAEYPEPLRIYRETTEPANAARSRVGLVRWALIAGMLDAAGVAAEAEHPALADARHAGEEMSPQDAFAYALEPHHELAATG